MLFPSVVITLAVVAMSSVQGLRFDEKKYSKVDFTKLRQMQKETGFRSIFVPANALMSAIHDGHKVFTTKTSRKELNLDTSDYQAFSSQLFYDTTYEFHLHETATYHSLDLPHHATAVTKMTETSMTQCGASASLKAGDFVIGSETGARHLLATHEVDLSKHEDFVVLRKVVSVSSSMTATNACHEYTTEDVTPFDVFDSFKLDAKVSSPFQNKYGAKKPKDKKDSNQLRTAESFPTTGIEACDSSNWHLPIFSYDENGLSAYVAPNLISSCVEYQKSLPTGNFNFNYDYETSSAVSTSIPLGQGVTCKDCYVFFGANFAVLGEYTISNGFAFESQLYGGLGFNVDLSVVNPVIHNTVTVPLVRPAAAFTYSEIGSSGVNFGIRPNGLNITVDGTGSSKGSASLSGGVGGSGYTDISYQDSEFTAKTNSSIFYHKPTFKSSGFKTVAFLLNGTLSASVELSIAFIYAQKNLLSFDYNFVFQPYLSYDFNVDTSTGEISGAVANALAQQNALPIHSAKSLLASMRPLETSETNECSTTTSTTYDASKPAALTYGMAVSHNFAGAYSLGKQVLKPNPTPNTAVMAEPTTSCSPASVSSSSSSSALTSGAAAGISIAVIFVVAVLVVSVLVFTGRLTFSDKLGAGGSASGGKPITISMRFDSLYSRSEAGVEDAPAK